MEIATPAAAALPLARAIARRAERSAVTAGEARRLNPAALNYLNRLSDHLFVMTRLVNASEEGDFLWVPGKAGNLQYRKCRKCVSRILTIARGYVTDRLYLEREWKHKNRRHHWERAMIVTDRRARCSSRILFKTAALATAIIASVPASAQTQVYVGACWAEVLPGNYWDLSNDDMNRVVKVAVYSRFFEFAPATRLDFMTTDKESSDAYNAYIQRLYRGQNPLLGGCRSQSQESYDAAIAKDKAEGTLVRIVNWLPSGGLARSPAVVEAAPTMPALRPPARPTPVAPVARANPPRAPDTFAANWLMARKFNITKDQRFTWFVNRDTTRRDGGKAVSESLFVSEATGYVFRRVYEFDCAARTRRYAGTRIYDNAGQLTSSTGAEAAVAVKPNSGDSATFNYACFGENAGFWTTVYRDPRTEAATQFRKNPR